MNNKGEMPNMGPLITTAIAIIIGAVIFAATVAPNVGTMTRTVSAVNYTFTAAAVNTSIDLTGQDLIDTPVVTNLSGTRIASGNYTIAEGVSPRSSNKRILLTFNDAGTSYASKGVNVSYTYGAEGYVDDAGGRGVVSLVPLMVALAILVAGLMAVNLKDLFD